MSDNPFDIVSKKIHQPPEGYEEYPKNKWLAIPKNSYIRWVWNKNNNLDKGGWLQWSKEKIFDNGKDIIFSTYTGFGNNKKYKNIYASKIKHIYVKLNTISNIVSDEPNESTPETNNSELDAMKIKLKFIESEIEIMNKKINGLKGDIGDLVGYIKNNIIKRLN